MKNINSALRKTKMLKHLFLLAVIFLLFLVFWFACTKGKKNITAEMSINKTKNIPEEFDFNINNSILEGLNKNNLSYTIKAKVITKQKDNIYYLNTIDAIHKLSTGNLHIVATNGLLDKHTNLLVLSENFKIMFNEFKLTGKKVNLNLNSNLVFSTDPVKLTYHNSSVRALNFYSNNSNNIISFEGEVVSIFHANDF